NAGAFVKVRLLAGRCRHILAWGYRGRARRPRRARRNREDAAIERADLRGRRRGRHIVAGVRRGRQAKAAVEVRGIGGVLDLLRRGAGHAPSWMARAAAEWT